MHAPLSGGPSAASRRQARPPGLRLPRSLGRAPRASACTQPGPERPAPGGPASQWRTRSRPVRSLAGRSAALVIAVWAGAASPARAQVQAQAIDPGAVTPSIVTTGVAALTRPPDVAYLIVGVEARARTPRDAQRQSAEAMAGVQQQLRSAGISADAQRTLGLSLEQDYDFQNGRRTLRGYVARNSLEVRIDDVARAGEVADQAVAGGAALVSGIRFDLKNRAEVEREALRLAVADARLRADAAAAGAGRTVDRVLRIDDLRTEPIVEPRVMALKADAGPAPSTPIEPGTLEIRARVSLTVSMK